MNETDIALHTVQVLTDKLGAARSRAETLATERQRLAYRVHGSADKAALPQLDACNVEMAQLGNEIEGIRAAFIEADARLAAARQGVERSAAAERCKHVEELLVALAECAPPLDVSWGRIETGQAGGFIHRVGPKNPPLFEKAGTLVAEIVVELRALRLDRGVAWPSPTAGRGFGIGTAEDLRRTFEAAVKQYAPARLPGTRNFVNLIDALATAVRAAMREYEAMTKEIAA